MKLTILLLSLLVLSTQAQSNTQRSIDIIEGLLVGALGSVGHEAKYCAVGSEDFFEDMRYIMMYFNKVLYSRDPKDLKQGFLSIVQAIADLPKELENCQNLLQEIKKFDKVIPEFKNPHDLIVDRFEKIVWHGLSLYFDIDNSTKSYSVQNYTVAGQRVGILLKLLH